MQTVKNVIAIQHSNTVQIMSTLLCTYSYISRHCRSAGSNDHWQTFITRRTHRVIKYLTMDLTWFSSQ